MGKETSIEYADSSNNLWTGCARVHTGCTNCYAEQLAKRNPLIFGEWGVNGTRVYHPNAARDVRRLDRQAASATRKPIVFWNDLSDTFEDWQGPILNVRGNRLFKSYETGEYAPAATPDVLPPFLGNRWVTMSDLRREMFEVIDECQHLIHLLFTKRPENIRKMWPAEGTGKDPGASDYLRRDNCWLMYSASDQETLDKGLPHLLECRDLSPVLGLSLEPLIGPVDLSRIMEPLGSEYVDHHYCGPSGGSPFIDWTIIGGESGAKSRLCDIQWIRSIRDQCRDAGVPCFVKQDSGRKSGMKGRLSDELWSVKEFPNAV